jgi:uncharacterized membrane protein YhhN
MKDAGAGKFILLFLFIVAMDLLGNISGLSFLNLVFKPLIVSSLVGYLYSRRDFTQSASSLAIIGLCMSWVGDCMLIFQEKKTLFFIGGLLSFLIAHIFYILYYVRSSREVRERKLPGMNLYRILLLAYGIGFGLLLNSHLGALKVPVFAYAAVLVLMNLFALNRYGRVSGTNFKFVMAGALLFAVSDGLLAINKFVISIPLAGIWIMCTYAGAQYLIAQSVLIANTKDN